MVQESISKHKTVGIIGGGPAGCICAKFLSDCGIDVTVFDKSKFLHTLLPTGGGKCNLAHNEYDFKNLAQNYPRGEKFLYSVFSKFSTQETLDFFNSIGVKTYTREKDNRIFPVSNSSADVREKILKSLKSRLINENIIEICPHEDKYKIKSAGNEYLFDYLVVAIGGHSDFNLIKNIGVNIINPVPSVVGFITKEDYTDLSGVSLKNICAKVDKKEFYGDMLFTHKGISGPLIYEISSVFARKDIPYDINLKFVPEIDLQNILNENSHKEIKNILAQFIPKSLTQYLLNKLGISSELKSHQINSKIRDLILENLYNYKTTVTGKIQDGEVVTCGGVDLKEINSKTLESKSMQNLYFCGEVLDIDGFCGGFNLQNCWSTGYITAKSIIDRLEHNS